MSGLPTFVLRDYQQVELSYYGIAVYSSKSDRQKLDSNKSLARLIIFLGLCLLIISSVDVSRVSSTLTSSEQSIWPSAGKGIWIGLFVIVVGIFTLISVREESHSSFYILLPYVLVAIVLCLFGLLTSISVLQRYTLDPSLSKTENRSKEQGIQFALNALLIAIFALTFLFLSCLSCLVCWTIPGFCSRNAHRLPAVAPPTPSLRRPPGPDIGLQAIRPALRGSPRLPYRPSRPYRANAV